MRLASNTPEASIEYLLPLANTARHYLADELQAPWPDYSSGILATPAVTTDRLVKLLAAYTAATSVQTIACRLLIAQPTAFNDEGLAVSLMQLQGELQRAFPDFKTEAEIERFAELKGTIQPSKLGVRLAQQAKRARYYLKSASEHLQPSLMSRIGFYAETSQPAH